MFSRFSRRKIQIIRSTETDELKPKDRKHKNLIKILLGLTLTTEVEKDLLWDIDEGFTIPYVIGEQFILKKKYGNFQSSSYHACLEFSLTTLFNERFSQNILLKLMNKINIYEKCQLIMIVIELEKRKHFILEYEKCFIGQQLIKSLLYYKMCTNKNDCIKMIKTWLKNNCISHVSNKIGSFKETEFYTFNKYIVYKKAYQSRTESNNTIKSGRNNNNNNNSQYNREYKNNNLNIRHSGNNLDKYRRKKRISFLSANKSINIGFVSDNEYYYDTVCTEDSTINGNKKYRFKKKRKSKVSPKKTKKKRAKTHENVLKFQRNDSENEINSVNDDAKELINLTDLDIKRCSYTDDMKEEIDTVSALHNNDSGQYKIVNSNTTTPLTLKDRRSSGIRITKVRRLSWFNLNN